MKWTSPGWVPAYVLWKLRWWAHGPLQILISWFKHPARRERSSPCSLPLQPFNELHTDKKCDGWRVIFLACGCDLNKSVMRAGLYKNMKVVMDFQSALLWRSSLVILGNSAIIPWQLHKYCTPLSIDELCIYLLKKKKGKKKDSRAINRAAESCWFVTNVSHEALLHLKISSCGWIMWRWSLKTY